MKRILLKMAALTAGLVLSIGNTGFARGAYAQSLLSASESENAAIRAELSSIAQRFPEAAAAARERLNNLVEPGASASGRQARNRRERGARRIVNGIHTTRHSAVAAILRGNHPATAQSWCTGTLVGCNKVLTAAHCISEIPDPKAYLVYFQLLGFFRISKIAWQPDKYHNEYADIAILSLEKSVEGIAPVRLNNATPPVNGAIATIVGYGRSGGTSLDYGIKREGSVKFDKCAGAFANKKLLCWNFDAEVNVSIGHANTCNADSGGGIFMQDKVGNRTVQQVVGVVGGGRDENCVKDDQSYNTDVVAWRDWLQEAGEGQISDALCGVSGAIDMPANIRTAIVSLNQDNPEAALVIDVPTGTQSLRVAMNGEDDGQGKNDFDFKLFKGFQSSAPACNETGSGQYAFCEIKNPVAGEWKLLISRKTGSGAAQLTVTTVPGIK